MEPDAGAFSAEAEWRLGKKQILGALGVAVSDHFISHISRWFSLCKPVNSLDC